MANLTRRQFGSLAAGASLVGAAPFLLRPALGDGPAKVVIIGGGPGGATVANRLKAANAALDITLIEPKTKYTTCFYSRCV